VTVNNEGVATAAGSFSIGGDLNVGRLGYGALQILGPGSWGPPSDRESALAVLRRLPELGINFIDTADTYGPFYSEELIHDALHPYDGVSVATKAGVVRTGPFFTDDPNFDVVHPVGRPQYLRFACEMSLRRLEVETIELWQLHRLDPQVPREEQFGVARELRDEGKIRHYGLSHVSIEEIEAARAIVEVASVSNRFNVYDRGSEDVLRYCERNGIAFVPWYPLGSGDHTASSGVQGEIAAAHEASVTQVVLAWLLQHSDVILLIPGTASLEHLEENAAAAQLRLEPEEIAALDSLG
jgi:pyridoxine 4-dehydrogenase